MANDQKKGNDWQECPQGEVSTMLRRIKVRRRKVFAIQLSGCAVVGVLLGIAFVQARPLWSPAPVYGGITCTEVHDHADHFVAGDLDSDLEARIAAHLKDCRPCAKLIERRKSAELRPVETGERFVARSIRMLPFAAGF